VKLNFRRF